MRTNTVMFAVGLLLFCGDTAAQQTSTPSPSGPLALDVEGVRLGMDREQAMAALGMSYQCQSQGSLPAIAQKVENEVQRRRAVSSGLGGGGLAISYDKCSGLHGEVLTIDYAEARGGGHPQVGSITRLLRATREEKGASNEGLIFNKS